MPSRDFEWTAAVAGFGMLLRNSAHRGQTTFDLINELAEGAKGDDPAGRRAEFLELVKKSQALVK